VVALGEDLLGAYRLAQEWAAPEELDSVSGVALFVPAEPIHPPEDARLGPVRHARHGVHLVVQGQVVEEHLLLLEHPPEPVADDDRDFVREGRVVGEEVGHRGGEDVAVSILVLKPLAG
jgi:hypothetical protein